VKQLGQLCRDSGQRKRKSDQGGCYYNTETSKTEAEKAENRAPDEAFLTSITIYCQILQVFMASAVQMAVPERNPCHTPTILSFRSFCRQQATRFLGRKVAKTSRQERQAHCCS
jgi:hypothetical protein